MSFKAVFNKRLLSAATAFSVVLGSAFTLAPSVMAASEVVVDTITGEASIVEDVVYEEPQATAPMPRSRAMFAPMSSGTAIDPSDLSTWTVYDTYYNPSWGGSKPSNWDSTHSQGSHPFFYWADANTSQHSGSFYDLSTSAGISSFESIVLTKLNGYGTPYMAHTSQHIYTKGNANNAEIMFLGYGSNYWVNFALAPIPASETGLKSVGFDIDTNNINAHSLDGFGIMFNAGVDAGGNLKGYAINFKMANNDTSTYNGSIYLSNFSSGLNAASLHTGNPSHLPASQVLDSFNLKQGMGIVRIDLDIEPTQVVVSYDYYVSAGVLSGSPKTYTVATSDTGYCGYGPFADFTGSGHNCSMMSVVKFSGMQMSKNYDVIFDKNGGTTDASPNRIYGIPKDSNLKTEGYSLPTPPTKAGSTFAGWNTSPNGNGTVFDENTPITKITTVYAQWTDDYTIKFIAGANGTVTGSNTNQSIPIGNSISSIPTPNANSGYNFINWTDETGKPYSANDIIGLVPTGNMTFTANFARVLHDVTFVPGPNGSISGGKTVVPTPEGNPVPTAPSPIPNPGYVFDGWTDENGKTVTPGQTIVNGPTTVTANFERDENGDGVPDKEQAKFTVNLTTQGPGSFGASDATQFSVIQRAGGNTTLKTDTIGGFTAPQLIPNTSIAPSAKFFWWLDPSGNKHQKVEDIAISGDCTLTAFFDKDENGDGIPDSEQGEFNVTLKTQGPGSFGASDATQFSVIQRSGGSTTLKMDTIGGFTAPQLIPNTSIAPSAKFFWWLDPSGNKHQKVEDIAISGDCTLTAFFDKDENGDGIPDSEQGTFNVTLKTQGPGSFGASDATQFSVIQRSGGSTTLKMDTVGGFTAPQLIPNTSIAPAARFFWWLDPSGNKHQKVEDITISGDCTLIAFFDADADGDGTPDGEQNQYVVNFDVKGNGKLVGTTTFDVFESNGSSLLGNAVGGFNAPTPKPNDKDTAFYRWEDEDGDEITDLDKYSISKSPTTIYAVFSEDKNGDGIADILQNKYTMKFSSDAGGRLSGTTEFTFIGGKKGDGKPLSLSDAVGTTFKIPTVTPINSEYSFKDWEMVTGTGNAASKVLALKNGNLKIESDMEFKANHNVKEYTIKFVSNNKTINTVDGPKGQPISSAGTVADPTAAQLPKSSTFQGWICPDGVLRSSSQVAAMNITGNMTFTAKYSSMLSVGRR